jgi:hypothetical protein
MCMPKFFPARRKCQVAYEGGSVVTARLIVNCCEMTERLGQQYPIKFYEKLGDTQVQTIHKIQQPFGDNGMSISRIKEWFNRFKDRCTSADRESHPGWPLTRQNDNVIIKCGLWSCRIVISHSENLQWRWG